MRSRLGSIAIKRRAKPTAKCSSRVSQVVICVPNVYSVVSSVLSVKGVHLPLPHERTFITCTLNNGIHFVTTPESQLAETSAIEQEFELYASVLAFST